jgi:hypothetical protein
VCVCVCVCVCVAVHADQPLWNSKECEGKIVAIMRGPRPPSSSCGYGIKVKKNAAACVVTKR